MLHAGSLFRHKARCHAARGGQHVACGRQQRLRVAAAAAVQPKVEDKWIAKSLEAVASSAAPQ